MAITTTSTRYIGDVFAPAVAYPTPADVLENSTPKDGDEEVEDDVSPSPDLFIRGPIPESLQEALDFVNNDESREFTYDKLLANNCRLKESSRLLASKFVVA